MLENYNPLYRLELKRDYMDTFSTPHGKRVLAHILSVAGVTRPRFTADNELTRINEGERRLAMSIFRFVHDSTDELVNLMVEETKRREAQQKQD
jgi:hypothetical protein